MCLHRSHAEARVVCYGQPVLLGGGYPSTDMDRVTSDPSQLNNLIRTYPRQYILLCGATFPTPPSVCVLTITPSASLFLLSGAGFFAAQSKQALAGDFETSFLSTSLLLIISSQVIKSLLGQFFMKRCSISVNVGRAELARISPVKQVGEPCTLCQDSSLTY